MSLSAAKRFAYDDRPRPRRRRRRLQKISDRSADRLHSKVSSMGFFVYIDTSFL